MANPSVTYTFANSTTADATQVNTNFNDIINSLTDGTKSLTIDALTCAGAATFNGNVTLGNGTPDDITFTGSLASSIPIKTTNSYDFGSSTIGLRSVYIAASDSAARTVRVLAGAVSASYSITLPTAVAPQTGMGFISDASGVLSYRYTEKTTSKTANYTATGDETTILCDASGGAFTITLPAAASFTGKHFYVKKTDTSYNAVTIDGNASETIDGSTTTTLNTQYEFVKIVCDGSNWHIVTRKTTTPAETFTPTSSTLSGSGTGRRWRNGDRMYFDIQWTLNAGLSANPTITGFLPTGPTVDTAKLANAGSRIYLPGAVASDISVGDYTGIMEFDSAYTAISRFAGPNGTDAWTSTAPFTWASGDVISCQFSLPITGWSA